MLSSDFVDACLYRRVAAAQLLEMAPLELKEIIQESDATGSPYLINLHAKTFCLQHKHVFAHMHLHDSVSLEDLKRRPQTVRLFCLLHADGVDITIARKAVLKAMKLSESQVTHNAASVKTARDFVKQLTNRDDRKKGRNSRE